MAARNPTVRSLAGSIGAHVMHSRNDGVAVTAAARSARRTKLDQRLLTEIDPTNKLPPAERERRLVHARSAYFARMALQRFRR